MNAIDTLQINADNVNRGVLQSHFDQQFKLDDTDAHRVEPGFTSIVELVKTKDFIYVAIGALIATLVLWYINFPNWFCLVLFCGILGVYMKYAMERTKTKRKNIFGNEFNQELEDWFASVAYYKNISEPLYTKIDYYIYLFNYELGMYFNNRVNPELTKGDPGLAKVNQWLTKDNTGVAQGNTGDGPITNYIVTKFDTIEDYQLSIIHHLENTRQLIITTFDSYSLNIVDPDLQDRHTGNMKRLQGVLDKIMKSIWFNYQWNRVQKHLDPMAEHFMGVPLYSLK